MDADTLPFTGPRASFSSRQQRERRGSSSCGSLLSRKSGSPLSRSASADEMNLLSAMPSLSAALPQFPAKLGSSPSTSTEKVTSTAPPGSILPSVDVQRASSPSLQRASAKPSPSSAPPSLVAIWEITGRRHKPVEDATTDDFSKMQSPSADVPSALTKPVGRTHLSSPAVPKPPTPTQTAQLLTSRTRAAFPTAHGSGSWRQSPSPHGSSARKPLAPSTGSVSEAARAGGSLPILYTPPNASLDPDEQVADTAEMAEAVEAVSSQIDKGLSLTGGDASLQDDRATTIDQAGAGDDRNVVAAHLPPQTSSEPAGGMDDDMDDVLEYIDDPNPRFHHAEVRNLPAPRQPEPQSKLPRAAEKLDSDSEPYEPVSDSAYSSVCRQKSSCIFHPTHVFQSLSLLRSVAVLDVVLASLAILQKSWKMIWKLMQSWHASSIAGFPLLLQRRVMCRTTLNTVRLLKRKSPLVGHQQPRRY